MKAYRDCKHIYNILLVKKKEALKAVHKRNENKLDFVIWSGLTFFRLKYKGIIGYNFKYYSE